MRSLVLFLACTLGVWAQNSTPTNPTPAPDSASSKPRTPNLAPPRSDRVNADDLDNEPGESSSKDTRIDLSPPEDDAKAHPQSSEILMDEEGASGNSDVSEFHPWNPHKEIGRAHV
jgi:hypothetical protein